MNTHPSNAVNKQTASFKGTTHMLTHLKWLLNLFNYCLHHPSSLSISLALVLHSSPRPAKSLFTQTSSLCLGLPLLFLPSTLSSSAIDGTIASIHIKSKDLKRTRSGDVYVLLRLVCNIKLAWHQWSNIHFHLIWRADKGLTICFL